MVDFIRPERPKILQEREETHGNFGHNAQISQKLKQTVRDFGSPMSDIHAECLDMILFKISRIVSGKSDAAEHWEDVVGYAQLGLEACKR